jgi:hypothetical protein
MHFYPYLKCNVYLPAHLLGNIYRYWAILNQKTYPYLGIWCWLLDNMGCKKTVWQRSPISQDTDTFSGSILLNILKVVVISHNPKRECANSLYQFIFKCWPFAYVHLYVSVHYRYWVILNQKTYPVSCDMGDLCQTVFLHPILSNDQHHIPRYG